MTREEELLKEINETVHQHRVVLFMKGSKQFPACQYSAAVVSVLKQLKADFVAVNVLADPQLRETIKVYSDWPTLPQLYIDGAFVGGADIVKQLYESGDLARQLSGPGQP